MLTIPRHTLARAAAAACLALCLLLMPGCEETVTLENYSQITEGMDQTEVEAILGGPGELQQAAGVGIGAGGVPEMQRENSDTRAYLWGDESLGIVVKFREGKVVHKQKFGL